MIIDIESYLHSTHPQHTRKHTRPQPQHTRPDSAMPDGSHTTPHHPQRVSDDCMYRGISTSLSSEHRELTRHPAVRSVLFPWPVSSAPAPPPLRPPLPLPPSKRSAPLSYSKQEKKTAPSFNFLPMKRKMRCHDTLGSAITAFLNTPGFGVCDREIERHDPDGTPIYKDGLVEVSQDSQEYWVRTPRSTTDTLGVSSSNATRGAF